MKLLVDKDTEVRGVLAQEVDGRRCACAIGHYLLALGIPFELLDEQTGEDLEPDDNERDAKFVAAIPAEAEWVFHFMEDDYGVTRGGFSAEGGAVAMAFDAGEHTKVVDLFRKRGVEFERLSAQRASGGEG